MYPYERSLVKRLESKPFALIGVNSDKNRETAKTAVKSEQLNWRSFWDQSTSGKIAQAWNINGWPTIFIIGVILSAPANSIAPLPSTASTDGAAVLR